MSPSLLRVVSAFAPLLQGKIVVGRSRRKEAHVVDGIRLTKIRASLRRLLRRTMLRSHVMKQILLRVTGVRAEVSLCEAQQSLRRRPPPPWKVKLAQRFHHPHVHGKGLLK